MVWEPGGGEMPNGACARKSRWDGGWKPGYQLSGRLVLQQDFTESPEGRVPLHSSDSSLQRQLGSEQTVASAEVLRMQGDTEFQEEEGGDWWDVVGASEEERWRWGHQPRWRGPQSCAVLWRGLGRV